MEQISIHEGLGVGACFMKKTKSPGPALLGVSLHDRRAMIPEVRKKH